MSIHLNTKTKSSLHNVVFVIKEWLMDTAVNEELLERKVAVPV
jgi:hypothetical protein